METEGKRPLIIGYGNPLRQDDGLGWRAAELVEQSGAPAEIIVCHQLTPELILRLESAPLVIFLDAAIDQPPGEVRVRPVTAAGHWSRTHDFTPDQLLGLAKLLGKAACPAMLVTGGVFKTDASEKLTTEGERCADEMARRALDIIQNSLCAL